MLADAAKQDIAEREVTILGDRSTPYSVLRKVMATCTDADYGKVSLAVIERERGMQLGPATQRTASLRTSQTVSDAMTTLAPYYRLYDLPWSPTEEVERRFRKVLRNAFILFAILAMLIPLLPVPEKQLVKAPEIPDRIVKLVIEKKAPPPPPPPPKMEEKKPKPVKKIEQPKPQPPKPDAREKAQKSACSSCRISSPTCATTRCSTRRR